jgi:hypothetical protein
MENLDDGQMQKLFMMCFNMPKMELNARLEACINPNTFLELTEAASVDTEGIDFYKINPHTISQIYAAIKQIWTSVDIVKRVTKEMIEDYAKHQAYYLEIRT